MSLDELSRVSTQEEIPDSVSKVNSDNVIKPKNEDHERAYSFDEYDDIITHAESLRQIDERKKLIRTRNERLEAIASSEKTNLVSESRVYEFANEMGIPKEFVDMAIALRYPSEEEKLRDLERIGLTVTNDEMIWHLKAIYMNGILTELRKNFPREEFCTDEAIAPYGHLELYHKIKKPIKKRFLWKTWYSIEEKKKILLGMQNSFDGDYLNIFSPLILRICPGLINELVKKIGSYDDYKHKLKIRRCYPLDLTKIPEFNS